MARAFQKSAHNKQDLYPDVKNIFGFKIDARFIVDNGKDEIDLGVVEVAKDDQDSKVINDLCKLARESKDNTDQLQFLLSPKVTEDFIDDLYTYMLQISGSNCLVSTNHLCANGLYVIIPRYSFSLPPSTASLPLFMETLANLTMLKSHLVSIAERVFNAGASANSIERVVGCAPSSKINENLKWARDTWYTPTHHNKSKVPKNFFSRNNDEEAIYIMEEDDDDSETEVAKSIDVDEYGFCKLNNGWYNVYTKKTCKNHPFQDDTDKEDNDD